MFLFTSVLSSILQVRNCWTHFWPMFSFYPLLETPENIPYIPWKHQKTFGFPVFHGDVKCVFWCFQGAQNGNIVQKWVNPFPKILRFGRCDVKRHNCEMSIYRLSLVFIWQIIKNCFWIHCDLQLGKISGKLNWNQNIIAIILFYVRHSGRNVEDPSLRTLSKKDRLSGLSGNH